MFKKIIYACFFAAVATGCTSLDRLENYKISPDSSFEASLAWNYKKFAEDEKFKYDWFDSGYFARKALRVLSGEDVMPEEISNWDIADENVGDLTWARERLVNVRNKQVMTEHPKSLAKVQFLYDCWVEEQEEAWQTGDINKCRMSFLLAMTQLETALFAPPTISSREVEPLIASEPEMPELALISVVPVVSVAENNVVYFGLGSDVVRKAGKRAIKDVLEVIKSMKNFSIKLGGHTDSVGGVIVNKALSGRRANNVAKEFVAGGIDKSAISVESYGESALAKPTADGVIEPLNRRVEINVTGTK